MERQPDISVVIPIYNESALLDRAVTELHQNLTALDPPTTFEVILAENGSSDDTPAVARALSEQYPEVHTFSHGEPNYGAALRRGMLEARGRYVICDEIDLCDVDFHTRALALLRTGEAELVVGSKAMRGASDRRPFVRRLATKSINGMLRILLGFRGTDTHGLKAFRRDALTRTATRCVVDKDLFASEFVIRAQRDGIRVVEIPISIAEKRPPSIQLGRRIPRVLRDLARLVYVIRIRRS